MSSRITFSFVMVLLISTAFAQNTQTLKVERFANSPLEIVDIRLQGVSIINKAQMVFQRPVIECKELRIYKPGWVRHLEIDLKNISNKDVSMMRGELWIDSSSDRVTIIPVLSSGYFGSGQVLKPNQTIELKVIDRGLIDINTNSFATLKVGSVKFTDNMMWRVGKNMIQDASNPDRWVVIDCVLVLKTLPAQTRRKNREHWNIGLPEKGH